MEFFAAGKVGYTARETAAAADAVHFLAAPRRGLCRSLRTADHAAAAGRLPGSGRPLHLYGVRTRWGAGLPGEVAAQSLSLCSRARHHLLFPRPARCGRAAHFERPAEVEILRSRDGPGTVLRPSRKLPS